MQCWSQETRCFASSHTTINQTNDTQQPAGASSGLDAAALEGPTPPAPRRPRANAKQLPSSIGDTEGDRHLARLSARYPSLSEPQALQDHVDKMRIRLKTLAFSLDPSGPVPDIVIPERSRRLVTGGDVRWMTSYDSKSTD